MFPFNVNATTIEIKTEVVSFESSPSLLSPENTLYRPSDEIVEKLTEEYAQAQSRIKKAHYATGLSCVAFAKSYLGIFGTWGNGGRNLSLNSTGQINDVVIFNYIHVAVIVDRVGDNLTIIEGNYDNHGSVRTRTLSVFDPSIRGFHRF